MRSFFIGLPTPRGSGTSGYVSANKAKPRQIRSKLEFLKELKQLREAPLPPPRQANKDILNHMAKREIYVQIAGLKKKYQEEGKKSEQEIEEESKELEKALLEKFSKGEVIKPLIESTKDTHMLAMEKEREQQRIKKAFKIQGEYQAGSAFDFELQEKQRLEKQYNREKRKMEREEEERKARKEERKKRRERSRSKENKAAREQKLYKDEKAKKEEKSKTDDNPRKEDRSNKDKKNDKRRKRSRSSSRSSSSSSRSRS